ncbi:MAG: hypothetical protein GY913_05055 [Proteobacteria bacterium]|nr:hypothetical protein [Pseudomonadota bacterium]MCP4916269.1 hypothetical protein [Pseudomonadota bacterium]
MRVVAAALAVLVTGWAAWVFLRPMPPRHPVQAERLMQVLDLDGDGVLTAPEFEGRMPPEAPWTLHDLDQDGSIGLRELEILVEELDPVWLIELE